MRVNEQNYVDEAERAILELKSMKSPNNRSIPYGDSFKIAQSFGDNSRYL